MQQGSFSSASISDFLNLMKKEGHEVPEVRTSDFSSQGLTPKDVWEGNTTEFGESRGEYVDTYNFSRCQRADGTAYGTKGKCRKGVEAPKEENQAKPPRTRSEKIAGLEGRIKELNEKIDSAKTIEVQMRLGSRVKELSQKLYNLKGRPSSDKLKAAQTALNKIRAKASAAYEDGDKQTFRRLFKQEMKILRAMDRIKGKN